jgi:integrase/recombinase XerD
MNIQTPTTTTPLRARMIADMSARNLGRASQTSHLRACKRFAAWLRRSPETASPDDVKFFQQHLIESGVSICTRNRTMTGVKFLFRVTLRRHDLVAEIFHLREPDRVPLVLSKMEVKRILSMAPTLKARVMLSLAYGCGLRAGEVVRLKVGDIDSAQEIIRIVQSKGAQGSQRDATVGHSGPVARVVEGTSGRSGQGCARARAGSLPRISRQASLGPSAVAVVS